MKHKLLTVCLVTYNHEKYIEQCLESILLQQTDFDFAIHVGEEDGSDATREIVEEYTRKYPDLIKLFKWDKKDKILVDGMSTGRYNFKETFKSTSSKYVAYCDGDDYWTDPLKLQKQVDFLENHPDFAICFHDVDIFDQERQMVLPNTSTRKVDHTTDISDLASGNYIHAASIVMRNDFNFPDWFDKVYLGDWALYMLQVKNRKIKRLNQVMAVYRVHASGLWAKQDQKIRILHTIETMETIYTSVSLSREAKHNLMKTIRKLRSQLQPMKKKKFFDRYREKMLKLFK